jgi:hypothetical protein
MACAIRGVISETLGLSKVSYRIFLIDNDNIAKIKNAEKGAHDCIFTSNDIVTSWFLSNCIKGGMDGWMDGWMVVNFRGKLDGHDDHLAGNYAKGLFYRTPEDTSSPADIRSSVKTMKRAVTANSELSDWAIASSHTGLVTNWASLAKTARLGGCKQLVHLPGGTTPPPTIPACLILRSRGEKLGVVVAGAGDVVSKTRAPFESDEEVCTLP